MEGLIRGHKKINQNVISTPSEITLKAFYSLLGEFNKQVEYKDLNLSKMELWKACGIQSNYNTKDFNGLVNTLTKSETYNLRDKTRISGSMFITKEVENRIVIHIPEIFREYVFNKKDINLMHKAKSKEKMDIAELDYYDNKVKSKSKELVLLNKAHLLGLKGKYNVRLYTLLKQWDSIGRYEKNWKEFLEVMEIPKSYKVGNIDSKILSKVKGELLKANIKITKIEKIKKGRSIDKIRILFVTINTSNVEEAMIPEVIENQDRDEESLIELKKKASAKTNDFLIRSEINACRILEEVNEKIRKYGLV